MNKTRAKLELDDAFIPKHIRFTEGDRTVELLSGDEDISIQVYKGSDAVAHVRVPLYARLAIAQMLTGTLNGQKLLK